MLASLTYIDDWRVWLTAALAISALLLGLYIISGLSMALKMLHGHLKTDIISGRLKDLGTFAWFAAPNHGCGYKKAVMELDGLDQPTIFKKFRIGLELKRNKAFNLGGRYIMLVHKKKGDFKKVDLLGISNGSEVFIARKDIFALYGLDCAQVCCLAVIGFLAGLQLFLPIPGGQGHESAILAAALACGLLPAAALFTLYRRAAAKFMGQAREKMEEFARTWDPEGGGLPSWALALSLPVDRSYAYLALGFIYVLSISLGYVWSSVLLAGFIVAAVCIDTIPDLTSPGFEMRLFKIEAFDEIRENASHSIYLKNAILRDPVSGVSKKIKKLFPGDELFNQGLMNPGLTRRWMIQAGKLGHPDMEETKRSLKLLGYLDDAKGPVLESNPADGGPLRPCLLLKLIFQNGLFGAFVLVIISAAFTGDWPASAYYLWLIPWVALFTTLKLLARKKVNSAVSDCFQNHPSYQNTPNFKGLENQRRI